MVVQPISNPPKLLGSWKEIACYLGKGVRTVQRWEQSFGLPVRRPSSTTRGIVCATPQELDDWLHARWTQKPAKASPTQSDLLRRTICSGIQAHDELVHTTQRLMGELTACIQAVAQECVALTLQNNGSHAATVGQTDTNDEEKRIPAGKDCLRLG
jgi:hypothetical protein